MRAVLAGFVALASFTVTGFGQTASGQARDAMAAEWQDLTPHPDWDPQANAAAGSSTGAEHCLKALDLATREKPDKKAALAELRYGVVDSDLYLLPDEMEANVWDWLAAAAASPVSFQQRETAVKAAADEIDTLFTHQKRGLLNVYTYLQKQNDLRAIYELLRLVAGPGTPDSTAVSTMEAIRISYGTNKKALFDLVSRKFQ